MPTIINLLRVLPVLVTMGVWTGLESGQRTSRKIRLVLGFVASLFFLLMHHILIYRFGYGSAYYAAMALTISLLILTIEDLRTKKLSERSLLFSVGMGLLCLFSMQGAQGGITLLVSLLISLVFVFISRVLKVQMGQGDGLVLAMVFLYFGWQHGLLIWAFTWLVGVIVSCLLMVMKKAKLTSEMPLVPYIFIAHLIVLFL